jgi:outer membrane receptor protein involved in Fe transport
MSIRRCDLISGASALACLLATASAAQAQAPRSFAIPAGPLGEALTRYAAQADRQILFTSDLVDGLRTAGLSGRYPPDEGLDRLLAGSGLGWSESRPGVVVLRRAARVEAALEEPTTVEAVVVTGTLLRGPGETPSPVTVISRDDLDRSGRATVADALVALPQNYAGSATPTSVLVGTDPMQSNSGFATGVNLRGLGPDSTLVLVNGRRLAGTGSRGDFADVSAIPTAAVQRIDVLLDGASALYGSDAVGGVVNIILRRDFVGQESRLRLGTANGGAESVIAAHTVGRRWSSGRGLLSYEYEHQGALNSSDRDYTRTGDLRPFGGTDRRTFYAAPGTVVTLNPAGGGFRAAFAIRPRDGGVATGPADFEAGSNFGNGRAGLDLLPQQDRHSVYAHFGQDIGSRIELTGDLRLSRREFDYASTAPITIGLVTRANPNFVSPDGAASVRVAYAFADELGSSRRRGSSESLGGSLGALLTLPARWDAEVYGAYGREQAESVQTGLLHSARLAEALGSVPDNPATPFQASRDGFLNLFGSGQANSATVLDFISSGFNRLLDRNEVVSANALVQGPLARLPGGEIRLALGAQVRAERLVNAAESFVSGPAPVSSRTPDRERRVTAAFAEARVPLVGAANARPGLRALDLSVAGRVETYDDIGSTANPKVGLLWTATDALRFRASWGTSFRAPALTEIYERYFISATFVSDGAAQRVALLEGGGNPDLEPETAESFTAGFTFRPRGVSGLRMEATWFDTRFSNQIGRPALDNAPQALLDPSLSPFVTLIDRNSPADRARVEALITSPAYLLPGALPAEAFGLIVNGRWVNTASVEVRGLDGAVSYDAQRERDRFRFEAAGSYVVDYQRALTPAASPAELVDRLGFPVDFRGTAAATWFRGDFSLRAGLNYVSGYKDAAERRIDSWTTADLQAGWSPGGSGVLKGLQGYLTVRNLLDEAPPFYDAPSGLGFDAGQADPLGRVVSLQLTKRW